MYSFARIFLVWRVIKLFNPPLGGGGPLVSEELTTFMEYVFSTIRLDNEFEKRFILRKEKGEVN